MRAVRQEGGRRRPRPAARRRRALLLAIAVATVVGPGTAARAAGVALRVVDPEGDPVRDALVTLEAVDADAHASRHGHTRWRRSVDSQGAVRFDRVRPGPWRVGVVARGRHDLVAPAFDPLNPSPFVVVPEGDETVETVVRLRRGTPIIGLLAPDSDELPASRIQFTHVDSGTVRTVRASLRDEIALALAPGRWRIHYEVPPGWLLTALRLDGYDQPGHAIVVTAEASGPTLEIRWDLEARSHILGRVASAEGCGVGSVVARLEEGGPWLPAARERGGMTIDRVEAGVDVRTCTYEMIVPDGTWSVRPGDGSWATSEPEQVELRLTPGMVGTADFSLTPGEGGGGDGGRALVVFVTDPDGKKLPGATVEAHDVPRVGEPRRGETSWSGGVILRASAGAKRIVAGHPDFLDAEIAHATGWEMKPEEAGLRSPSERTQAIRLGPAATVAASLGPSDPDLAEAPPLELVIESLDLTGEGGEGGGEPGSDEPATAHESVLIEDAGLVEHRTRRRLRIASRGRVEARGLVGGRHRLRARVLGAAASHHLARVKVDGVVGESVEVELAEGETTQATVSYWRAAGVTTRPACRGEAILPPSVDVRARRVLAGGAAPARGGLLEAADLSRDGVALAGDGSDELVVGPLEPGAYVVGVRPAGFDRWTWWPGTESLDEAAPIVIGESDPLDVGWLDVDCSPHVHVLVGDDGAPDGVPLAGSLQATWEPLDDRSRALGLGGDAWAESIAGGWRLTDLAPVEARLALVAESEWFLPNARVETEVELDLAPGALARVRLPVTAIGGAIEVRGPGGIVEAIPRDVAAPARAAPLVDGRALLGNLHPGLHVVRWCSDASCAEPLGEQEVLVEAARTVAVRWTAGD